MPGTLIRERRVRIVAGEASSVLPLNGGKVDQWLIDRRANKRRNNTIVCHIVVSEGIPGRTRTCDMLSPGPP